MGPHCNRPRILIHTSRNRSGYQCRTRTAKMAIAVGLPAFTQAEAQSFYGELGKVVKREIQMTRAVCGGNVHTPEFRLGGFSRKDYYFWQARRTVRCMRNLQTP